MVYRLDVALPPEIDDDFWEDLITLIKQGSVIPVVGERAVTYGDQNELLYGWLVQKLAEKLKVSADHSPGCARSSAIQRC